MIETRPLKYVVIFTQTVLSFGLSKKIINFYSHSSLHDITDADYEHTKRGSKGFELKNIGEYHDLYVQCDTLLLADVFENFRNVSWNTRTLSYKLSFSFRISLESCFENDQSNSLYSLNRVTKVTLFIDMQKVIINT